MPPAGRRPAQQAAGGNDEPTGAWTPEVFAARLQECTPILWTVAAGILGERNAAEDVVQEAALIGLRKLDSFQPGTKFVSWMARIVRNVALNHGRRAARRRTDPLDEGTLGPRASDAQLTADHGTSPGQRRLELADHDPQQVVLEDGFLEGELGLAVGELPPTARACLLLKVVLDLEYKQIAQLLEIPEGTAMSHVHRTQKLLQQRLGAGDGSPRTNGHEQPKKLTELADATVRHSRSTIDAETR
jgi:RNA polymerase sigma-70 factor (ECF subfamily)